MALLASPILGGLSRSPTVGIILLVVAASSMALSTLVHLLTLPVELDASFRRALPILAAAELIPYQDLDSARKILSACALTYVANSLFSLVNIFNWLRFLRR